MLPLDITQRLYRVSRLQEMLDISRSKTYQLIQTGEIPAVRIGKSVRISAEALNQYLAKKIAEGLASTT